jgi:hypothetical protein
MLGPVYLCCCTHVQAKPDADGNRVRCKRVGIMYSVWHWPAVRAMDIQRAAGKVPVTVEDVIRSRKETPRGVAQWRNVGWAKALPACSVHRDCPKHFLRALCNELVTNACSPFVACMTMALMRKCVRCNAGVAAGARTLSDVIITPGVYSQSMAFLAHYSPQLGFYCLYKRRAAGTLNYNPANEGVYQTYKNQPDCRNITGILTQHAQWLTAAGIDYVVVRRDHKLCHENSVSGSAEYAAAAPSICWSLSVRRCRSTPPTFRTTTQPRTPSSCGLSRSCVRCALMSTLAPLVGMSAALWPCSATCNTATVWHCQPHKRVD